MSISRCFCAIFTALIGVRPRLSLCFCWVLTNLSVCLAIQHIPTYFPNQDVIFDQVEKMGSPISGSPPYHESTWRPLFRGFSWQPRIDSPPLVALICWSLDFLIATCFNIFVGQVLGCTLCTLKTVNYICFSIVIDMKIYTIEIHGDSENQINIYDFQSFVWHLSLTWHLFQGWRK